MKILPISYRLIGDHISDGFLLLDDNFCVVEFNRAFAAFFEKIAIFQRKNDIYDFVEKLKTKSDFDLADQLRQALTKSDCTICELAIESNSGMQYFQVEITPVYKMESFLGLVLLFKDTTRLRNSVREIEKNQRLLIQQNRRVFIGQLRDGIIHNLKNPMMSLAGGLESINELVEEYRQLINEGFFTAEDHLEIAREMTLWVEKMKPYCSTVSDIVSAVKGQIAPPADKTSFSVDNLLTRIKLLLRFEMKKNNIDLDIYGSDRELLLYGPIDDLIQVLSGILTCVIEEFGEIGGKIRLSVSIENNWVVFSVRGFGKEMSAKTQKSLFKEGLPAQGREKTGFGLYMANCIIQDSFKGHIQVDFQEGKRSTYLISIPRGR